MIIPYIGLITYQQQREHLLMDEYEVLCFSSLADKGFHHFPKYPLQ
jgi:hypothetical protein